MSWRHDGPQRKAPRATFDYAEVGLMDISKISSDSTADATETRPGDPRELRRVVFSSYLGSTIEFYDFLLYGTAAAIVFPTVFFSGLDPLTSVLFSFGTFAAGYVARPLGGVL